MAVKCDVTNEKDLDNLWDSNLKRFGGIDIYVNNADVANEQTSFHQITPDVFMKIIDINIKGLMLSAYVSFNRMLHQGYGAIYNMEGLGSDGRVVSGLIPYGTSKRAVRYFTDAFAKEVMNSPVIIGTISQGMGLTDMTLAPLKRDPVKKRQHSSC